ncbi:hypothetical protein WAE58_04360 [Pedobacter panaciterrae]|uniref:DUF2116 family Zn-ribbon domain-containing protein n=1 Tax=Pedobacter panaciterrae TaxID=363849 RepID=A0ABU8NHC3_9SPHI
MELKNIKKDCLYCGKALTGREDKLFCNVDCKNNYHSRQRAELKAKEHPNAAAIISTIKNNYKILLTYQLHAMDEGSMISIPKHELTSKGFNERFHTSTFTKQGETWHCCFDCAWLDQGKNFVLTYRAEQAIL